MPRRDLSLRHGVTTTCMRAGDEEGQVRLQQKSSLWHRVTGTARLASRDWHCMTGVAGLASHNWHCGTGIA
eukprot:162105-Chlamydomonas_euryale.AAC.1